MWTENFHMFKVELKKAEEPEIKVPTSAGEFQRNFRIFDYAKDFDCVDHKKLESS